MDLESENSALESTGDNDLVCSADPPIGDESDDVKSELNGSCFHGDRNSCGNNGGCELEIKELNSDEQVSAFREVNSVGKEAGNDQSVGVESPKMPSPVTAEKGKGLRRWRRIRRGSWDDNGTGTSGGGGNVEVTKLLKRGLANLGSSMEVAVDMRHRGEAGAEGEAEAEGSVSSTNAFVNNPVGAKSFSNGGSSSVYEVVGVSTTFSVGADSDNSEDWSSKSSTAASMPKSRLDQSRALVHSREKHRTKHVGRKSLGNALQTVQQGPRQLDGGKKARGEAVNNEKENSLSSLESDSRNYSSAFMQGSSPAVSNGHSGRLMGSDGERSDSDDEPAGEEQSVEGLPNGRSRSVGEGEETSQGDAALSCQLAETIKNHKTLENGDPLVDCVQKLESVQQLLEQELHKFIDLGKDLRPLDDDLIKDTGLSIFSKSFGSEIQSAASNWPTTNALDAFANKLVGQAWNVEELVKQLEETTMLKDKELRIVELEAIINEMKSSSEDLGRSAQAERKKYSEIETEMEVLFTQKTEAEIKYLAIADKSIIAERQMKALLAKQESLVSTQERKSEEGLSTEKVTSKVEIQKMQSRVAKFSSCFLIQLVLFVFVAGFFWSQLLPKSEDVAMPT